jgi:hypothetical protein
VAFACPTQDILSRFTELRVQGGRGPGCEDDDAARQGGERHVGMDAWILQHLGRSGDPFRFLPRLPGADGHPTLGTGQEEKVGPDDEEQEHIDGAGEIVHRHGEKRSRRWDAFVIIC